MRAEGQSTPKPKPRNLPEEQHRFYFCFRNCMCKVRFFRLGFNSVLTGKCERELSRNKTLYSRGRRGRGRGCRRRRGRGRRGRGRHHHNWNHQHKHNHTHGIGDSTCDIINIFNTYVSDYDDDNNHNDNIDDQDGDCDSSDDDDYDSGDGDDDTDDNHLSPTPPLLPSLFNILII